MRLLLFWLADRGIGRVSTEEAVKRHMLRQSERAAAVVTLPAAERFAGADERRAAGTES